MNEEYDEYIELTDLLKRFHNSFAYYQFEKESIEEIVFHLSKVLGLCAALFYLHNLTKKVILNDKKNI